MWECTECGTENDLDPDAEEAQILDCLECGAEFEIVALDPLELTLLFEAPDEVVHSLEGDDEAVDDDDDDDREPWVG